MPRTSAKAATAKKTSSDVVDDGGGGGGGAAAGVPKPPKELRPAALIVWRRLVKLLAGQLRELDEIGLTVLASSFADYWEAQRMVDENGTVVRSPTDQPMKNPYCLVMKESWDRIRPLLSEFGLSPAARAKLKLEQAGDDGEIEV